MIFYVDPHRAVDDLTAMAEAFGARRAALARELTKLHEEVMRATLPQLVERTTADGVRGEVTVVVEGAPEAPPPATDDLVAQVEELVKNGMSRRDAVATVAGAAGVPRRALYQAVLDAGGQGGSGGRSAARGKES